MTVNLVWVESYDPIRDETYKGLIGIYDNHKKAEDALSKAIEDDPNISAWISTLEVQ